MISLQNDDPRCQGVQYDGEWREGCERCARRLAPTPATNAQMIDPPPIIAFECEYLVEVPARLPVSAYEENLIQHGILRP